jgi:hypothetical protein
VTDPGAAAPVEPHRPALVVSAALLGDALQLNNGFYGLAPIALVTVALALAWLALTAPRALNAVLPDRDRAVAQVILAVVVMQLLLISAAPIGFYFRHPMPWQHPGFVPGLVVAGLGTLAATLAGPRRWLRLAAATAVVAAATWLGVLTYRGSPTPAIDVVPVHHDAFAALGRGESPYSMTFADIYAGTEQFYPPGMAVDGRVLYGFPYPPLSLAMAWPGHLAGDFRYAELAALVAAAAFAVAAGRASAVAIGAIAILLFTPRAFFALEQAWTEPFAIVWVAGAIWAAATRRPLAAAAFLGLAAATKQYLALAVPAAWLLGTDRATSLRALAVTVGVAGIALLPALGDLSGFLHSAVMVQVREVLRMDSLSLAVTWAERSGAPMSGAAYAALVLAAAGLAVWRAPATPSGVAAALAVTLFTAFAFGKKAFCNYYVMVLSVLVLAIAVRRKDQEMY